MIPLILPLIMPLLSAQGRKEGGKRGERRMVCWEFMRLLLWLRMVKLGGLLKLMRILMS